MSSSSSQASQASNLLDLSREVTQQIKGIKERMYPSDQEKRALPEDIPSKKDMKEMLDRAMRIEKTIRSGIRKMTGATRLIRLKQNCVDFLHLDNDIYDLFLLMKVIYIYIYYHNLINDTSEESEKALMGTFNTDETLGNLVGEGPHSFTSLTSLLRNCYYKKSEYPITDEEIENSKEFLTKERAFFNDLSEKKDQIKNLRTEIGKLYSHPNFNSDDETEVDEEKIINRRLKNLEKKATEAEKSFKKTARRHKLFQKEMEK